jgi:iron complex transport system substrate-binding protein
VGGKTLKKRFILLKLMLFYVLLFGFFFGANPVDNPTVSSKALSVVELKAADHPSVPRRVVSMGPNLTETIFALGRGDRVVGVTDFSSYPPEAKKLPKVGGYINPNLERITALRPDLVIVRGKYEKVDKYCRSRGIRIVHVNMDNLTSIYQGIYELGRIFGKLEKAQDLCAAIRNQLEKVSREAARYPRQKVFVCLGRAPGSLSSIYTAGRPSFITEILKVAGGDNIFEDVKQPYPEASKESLIRRAPEVILEMRAGEKISESRRRQIIDDWKILGGVPAITKERIYVLTEDFLLVPGPRVGIAASFLLETLQAEIKSES